MEFGAFDHLDRNDLPLKEFYEARLKLIEAYERAGFYAYHLAEHHSTPIGLAPSPSVFLSAIAQRTKRLRFGPLVYALPVHHPLRLIEEICMLDQLSGGRLEIGFGRGSSPVEVAYYGQDPAEACAIARRAYPVWHRHFYFLFSLRGGKPAHPRPAEFDKMMEIGQAVAGTPDTVLAFLQSQVNDSAANYLVGQFAFGDLSFAESLRSVELFTRAVMPALRATD